MTLNKDKKQKTVKFKPRLDRLATNKTKPKKKKRKKINGLGNKLCRHNARQKGHLNLISFSLSYCYTMLNFETKLSRNEG